eukprot:318764-Rhodomonas_salina.2
MSAISLRHARYQPTPCTLSAYAMHAISLHHPRYQSTPSPLSADAMPRTDVACARNHNFRTMCTRNAASCI